MKVQKHQLTSKLKKLLKNLDKTHIAIKEKPYSNDKSKKVAVSSRPLIVIIAFSVTMISVFAFVLFFIQTRYADQSDSFDTAIEASASSQNKNTTTENQRLKAQRNLEQLLLVLKDAEQLSPQVWAINDWKAIEALLTDGEMHYRRTHFILAQKKYHEATQRAQNLINSAQKIKIENITIGDIAIKNWDSVGAERAYKIVLSIEPSNPDGTIGLKRATTLEKVKVLMEQGQKHEKSGQLEKAKNIFKSVIILDKYALGAQAALVRVNFKERPRLYQLYMSSSLALLRSNKYGEAEAFLLKAQAIDDSTAVKDALSLLNARRLTDKINRHLEQADKAEQEENWSLVENFLNKAIRLDSGMVALIKRKNRARVRAKLDEEIKALLNKRYGLESKKDIKVTKSLLSQALLVTPKQKEIQKQVSGLKQKLELSKTPIALTLESDGLTTVEIVDVNVLKTFKTRTVQFSPGVYTLLGTRLGYQSVNRTIRISNLTFSDESRITIVCSKKD